MENVVTFKHMILISTANTINKFSSKTFKEHNLC